MKGKRLEGLEGQRFGRLLVLEMIVERGNCRWADAKTQANNKRR